MTTINDTVTTTLARAGLSGYEQQARPVIDALVQREQQITADLIEGAVQRGIPRDEAVRVFEGVGLTLPTPDPVAMMPRPTAAPAEGGNLAAQVTALARAVADLTEFARSTGFRG